MLKQLFLVTGLSLMIISPTLAQQKSGQKQIGITDKAEIEKLMMVLEDIGSSSKELLREQSLKSYMMPNRKALERKRSYAYVVASCFEFYVNFNSNFKVNLSPDFLAIQHGGEYKGLLTGLVQKGTVNAAVFPYGSAYLNEAVQSTQVYQAENFLHLFRPDIGARQKIFELRKALMRGNPVMVEIQVDEAFMNLAHTAQWSYSGTSKNIQPIIVTGYSEDKKAFEVTTVYGNEWGRDGYAWITYEDMGKLAKNAYVLVVQR